MANMRDSKGRFVKADSYSTGDSYGHGRNKGAQTWASTSQGVTSQTTLHADSYAKILAHPAVLAAVQAKTDRMLQDAQALAVTEDALYGNIVYNNRPELGPVGVVFCDNFKSVVDDLHHSTLYKVLGHHDT